MAMKLKMKKNCPISKKSFLITENEKKFIDQISPQFCGKKYLFPFPEICPEERVRMRVLHRNEQYLYKNSSAFTGKPLISLYRPHT